MAATKYIFVVTVLATLLQGVVSQDLPVTQACLGCICEAISRCNTSSTCSGDVCGPFRITWGYWADSGKPVLKGKSPDDQDAYSSCAGDTYCAALSVQGYMRKFQQDCNGDGKIDCDDFALIHTHGGYGCAGILPEPFGERYRQCKQFVGQYN